ncbi:MAG: tRNA (N6-isopentenyl adenosine(37)-C2)-methylthiotransferase MiaB [Clostridia bacterium]|nr:tRNA (N6-isopentenyl adenosine(37)-C2)-methylthiotransferase MiaB [Clostridia bacterium]
MDNKFYKINIYGCQMNVHESEKIAGILEEMGYTFTNDDNLADIIVFNTCCIRENAENSLIGHVGALKPLKKKKKGLIIAVGGCMTQQNGVGESLMKTFPFVDVVFGTHNLHNFKNLLENRIKTGKRVIEIKEGDLSICESITPKRTSYPNAWVNVMYGCNNFCTYCIVPYVRGREKSRMPSDVINEVKSLINEGYKEITLLGQNVDSYGKTADFNYDFADLITEIDKIEGDYRLRFMSNHPKDVNEKLVLAVKNSKHVCRSIHLPVQSGSTKILALMNRKYTREEYLEKVNLIRRHIPECAITSDVMVGFPNETEEDFLDTVDLVKQASFDGAFTFVYSKRKGTKAYDMDGHIDEAVKKDRIMRLVDVQNAINREKSKKYNGKTVTILCEDYDDKKGFYQGRDEFGRMIYFYSNKNLIGEFVDVTVVETGGISLKGEIKG